MPYGYAPAMHYPHSPYMYPLPQVTICLLSSSYSTRHEPTLPQPHQNPFTARTPASLTPPVASLAVTPRILTAEEVAENNARREKAMEDLRAKEKETRDKLLALQKVSAWLLGWYDVDTRVMLMLRAWPFQTREEQRLKEKQNKEDERVRVVCCLPMAEQYSVSRVLTMALGQVVEKLVFGMLDKVEKTIKRDDDREEKQRYKHSDCAGMRWGGADCKQLIGNRLKLEKQVEKESKRKVAQDGQAPKRRKISASGAAVAK